MNRNNTTKVIYLVAIAVLMVPLYVLSRPETKEKEGGWLARMRKEHRLSQARIGEIDPAGAAMSLATFGLRGIAANQLWGKAIDYQKKEDYVGLKATLNQVAKLQPNFVSVWNFQAWNLSYNVSVEFDDYRHRYHWVKKGIDYLIEGTQYNKEEPMLRKDVGWFFSHKIGRADERKQYRRLYRNDVDFHEKLSSNELPVDFEGTMGPDGKPDNWLMAHDWYRSAENLVDTRDIPIKNPILFHSRAPMALIYYANYIEKDGYLDEKGQNAWRTAGRAWDDYGNRPMATTAGRLISLNQLDEHQANANAARQRLVTLMPGVSEQIFEDKKAKLPPAERALVDADVDTLPLEKALAQQQLLKSLVVSASDLLARAPAELRKEARRYARQEREARSMMRAISMYRENSNYEYWKMRCEIEQLDRMIEARRHVMEADRLESEAFLEPARAEYEAAWDAWADVFEQYPAMIENNEAEELMEPIGRYKTLLGRLDEAFPPPDFKLRNLLDYFKDTHMEIEPSGASSEKQLETPETEQNDQTTEDEDAADPEKEALQESSSGTEAEAVPDEICL